MKIFLVLVLFLSAAVSGAIAQTSGSLGTPTPPPTVPTTANLLKGDNAGNAADAGIAATNVPILNGQNTFTGTRNTFVHIATSGSAPSATANTAGAGSGPPTVTVSGSDTVFDCTFTTGSSPGANSTVFTVTFATAYATTPKVVGPIYGNNNTAVALGGARACSVNSVTTTGFTMTSGTTGLVGATALDFYFLVFGQP